MHTTLPKLLGLAGLIPFIAPPVLAMTTVLSFQQAIDLLLPYSAIILSFLGGVHWHDVLQNQRTQHQFYVAMLPSIAAWLIIVFIPPMAALLLLSVSYVAIALYDVKVLRLGKEYIQLRIFLTLIVVICHLQMMGYHYLMSN